MFKAISLFKRRSDMTHEEFTRHYYETHAALSLKIPGLKKYVTNEIIGASDGEPEWDWVAEGWFESKEALEAGLASPAGQAAIADVPNFVAPNGLVSFLVDEKQHR